MGAPVKVPTTVLLMSLVVDAATTAVPQLPLLDLKELLLSNKLEALPPRGFYVVSFSLTCVWQNSMNFNII